MYYWLLGIFQEMEDALFFGRKADQSSSGRKNWTINAMNPKGEARDLTDNIENIMDIFFEMLRHSLLAMTKNMINNKYKNMKQ